MLKILNNIHLDFKAKYESFHVLNHLRSCFLIKILNKGIESLGKLALLLLLLCKALVHYNYNVCDSSYIHCSNYHYRPTQILWLIRLNLNLYVHRYDKAMKIPTKKNIDVRREVGLLIPKDKINNPKYGVSVHYKIIQNKY